MVSFNQPAFIPWGGFFARQMVSDTMVLLDDTLFARGFTFVNKNRIKGPQQEVWLTVPVRKKGLGRQKISELEIHNKQFWREKFAATLYHMYGRSMFFDDIARPLIAVANDENSEFTALTNGTLDILKANLGIENGFFYQSALGVTKTGIDLLLEITRKLDADEVILPFGAQHSLEWRRFETIGIKVWFLKYIPVVYPQFWGRFRANLSALDLLLCMGPESKRVIKAGTQLIQL